MQKRLAAAGSAPEDQVRDLCLLDEDNPYSSVMIVDNQYRKPITLDGLSKEQKSKRRL